MSGGGIGGGNRRRDPEAHIMITSMMDIFTIILAFLLFQFTTDDQSILIANNMDIPASFKWLLIFTAAIIILLGILPGLAIDWLYH